MKFPQLKKAEWYFIAVLFVLGLYGLNKLLSNPTVDDKASGELKKDFSFAMLATAAFFILNRIVPQFLVRYGFSVAALAGWPVLLAAGGVFAAFGGYEIIRSAIPFLPRLGGNPASATEPLSDQEAAAQLCAPYGGFSHWVAPASNMRKSAACMDQKHYAHLP